MKTASPVEHCAAQRWCNGWPTVSVSDTGGETSNTWLPDRVLSFLAAAVSRYSSPAADKLSRPCDNNVHHFFSRNWLHWYWRTNSRLLRKIHKKTIVDTIQVSPFPSFIWWTEIWLLYTRGQAVQHFLWKFRTVLPQLLWQHQLN